ncbi:MAG: hypothetical protein FRX48_07105 [Lasallia pustulata]|uniref:Uncharacterized protein n=1 Tax=Lasallia pustulata TaxID=136370 RepID=A0A5M8PJI0_9LECA|nr:MAG: hypothetical protein FRX48_07105 [Lasallia pustulata]
MLRWQDKSSKYLDHYAKLGKAAAVRYLLEARCKPGTRKKARPEPLLNAVRGGSERHNKRVRILLEFEADVNIVSGNSGKTPLHYAIEHRHFKGYRNLIFILLDGGADLNIKDYSGDVPLPKYSLWGL